MIRGSSCSKEPVTAARPRAIADNSLFVCVFVLLAFFVDFAGHMYLRFPHGGFMWSMTRTTDSSSRALRGALSYHNSNTFFEILLFLRSLRSLFSFWSNTRPRSQGNDLAAALPGMGESGFAAGLGALLLFSIELVIVGKILEISCSEQQASAGSFFKLPAPHSALTFYSPCSIARPPLSITHTARHQSLSGLAPARRQSQPQPQ